MAIFFALMILFIFSANSLSRRLENVTQRATFNPVSQPVIQSRHYVHTRFFAQIPPERNAPARIICIVPHQNYIYVCTMLGVYKVSSNGIVQKYFDVHAAIGAFTNRQLALDSPKFVHGGVRSIAFHPTEDRVYISVMETRPDNLSEFHYISDVENPIQADSVLLEFRVDRAGRPVASSYRCVFRVGMPKFDHTIRQMAFFGDALYIAHGDGSEQAATVGGGQNPDALGKILRIYPRRVGNLPFTVPDDNPFIGGEHEFPDSVYAYGFRNPHTICFAKNGLLFVADAGRSNVEEVNIVIKGGNYGWPAREGTFVHIGGGLITGVEPLPEDDAKYGYIYPVAQYGHEGAVGAGFIGQAIAGGCPVENLSPMRGKYYYSDFPETGRLFFSNVPSLLQARIVGEPSKLTQATTFLAKICYDHDGDPTTPPKQMENLREVIRDDPDFENESRVDVRFGRGPEGQLFWSSKRTGRLYLFTSSLKGSPEIGC